MTEPTTAPAGLALVIGATGSIGAALLAQLQQPLTAASHIPAEPSLESATTSPFTPFSQASLPSVAPFAEVLGLSRSSTPSLDLLDESSIQAAAQHVALLLQTRGLHLQLVIDATGMLHSGTQQPEKSWAQLDAAQMAQSFAINAIGPALLMKHFLPLLPRQGRAVFATLSAKVGSIGDNRLGGWYSYRASKAALNQLVHTAAIELRRRAPQAICVALHPGTVHSDLSAPFAKTGLEVRTPQDAAQRLLAVMANLKAEDSGGFFSHDGQALPW